MPPTERVHSRVVRPLSPGMVTGGAAQVTGVGPGTRVVAGPFDVRAFGVGIGLSQSERGAVSEDGYARCLSKVEAAGPWWGRG